MAPHTGFFILTLLIVEGFVIFGMTSGAFDQGAVVPIETGSSGSFILSTRHH